MPKQGMHDQVERVYDKMLVEKGIKFIDSYGRSRGFNYDKTVGKYNKTKIKKQYSSSAIIKKYNKENGIDAKGMHRKRQAHEIQQQNN